MNLLGIPRFALRSTIYLIDKCWESVEENCSHCKGTGKDKNGNICDICGGDGLLTCVNPDKERWEALGPYNVVGIRNKDGGYDYCCGDIIEEDDYDEDFWSYFPEEEIFASWEDACDECDKRNREEGL